MHLVMYVVYCNAFSDSDSIRQISKVYRASWYIAGTSPCCAAFWYLKAHYFTVKAELTE